MTAQEDRLTRPIREAAREFSEVEAQLERTDLQKIGAHGPVQSRKTDRVLHNWRQTDSKQLPLQYHRDVDGFLYFDWGGGTRSD
jgi:hypothetical protein